MTTETTDETTETATEPERPGLYIDRDEILAHFDGDSWRYIYNNGAGIRRLSLPTPWSVVAKYGPFAAVAIEIGADK